jgi:FkbM family methyltransferase
MQSKIGKYTVNFFNEQEFHSLKREIFTYDSYYFESEKEQPVILDIGAYIGLSVLYFKQLYPDSRIVAFEPNPIAFEMLKENMFINNIQNVELLNCAIWTNDGKKEIYIDDTDMNRYSVASFRKNCWNGEVRSRKLEVVTKKLGQYIEGSIDMLKLDVEGAEQQILKDIVPNLTDIRNIVIEYHPTPNQNIDRIISLLEKRYEVSIFDEGKEVKRNIPKDKLLTINATYRH